MSLKSFDDFCAKIVNNDPIEQKVIFDERQSIVRSQITVRALWAFVIMASINLIIMECFWQWCESWVLSTAIFGAISYLYWVAANARRDTLFGINGTIPVLHQTIFIFGDSIIIPLMIFSDKEHTDIASNFFIRNGMVSDYFAMALACALYLAVGIVMAVNVRKFKKKERETE
ncbi:MAG: hypothetical protein K2J80_03865 [Oscillospiraceae bacterium]|nr:hypothetical protein [Oscillospiraceae bacterium]